MSNEDGECILHNNKGTHPHSMEGILRIMMGLQITVIAGLLLAFIGVIGYRMNEESENVRKNFLKLYSQQIESCLDTISQNMSQILNETELLEQLSDSDENRSGRAAVTLRSVLSDIQTYSEGAECYCVYEGTSGRFVSSWNQIGMYQSKMAAENFIMNLYESGENPSGWYFRNLGDELFVVKSYRWNNRIIAAMIRTDSLLNLLTDTEDMGYSLILADSTQTLEDMKGEKIIDAEFPCDASALEVDGISVSWQQVGYGDMYLYAVQRSIQMLNQMKSSYVLLLLAIFILFLVDIGFSRLINRRLIRPLEDMTEKMDSMTGGSHELRIPEKGQVREFAVLAGTFNRLMDEIFRLKISEYEKKLDLAEAEEKYLRLQIKPHFFLNALTTISGLARQGKNGDIEVYIQALNRNIRYMFSSGLHTVACRDEMEHVRNYFAMQELKYPDMVFWFIDLPEELEEWRIPQMIIHTVIENEYKYAVTEGSLLSIYVRVEAVRRGDEDMLMVEIEDDGPGYPQAVIDYMQEKVERPEGDGRQVGLWSLKRIMELMYERKGLLEVGNGESGGARCCFYIPAEPVHDRRVEGKSNTGIR